MAAQYSQSIVDEIAAQRMARASAPPPDTDDFARLSQDVRASKELLAAAKRAGDATEIARLTPVINEGVEALSRMTRLAQVAAMSTPDLLAWRTALSNSITWAQRHLGYVADTLAARGEK